MAVGGGYGSVGVHCDLGAARMVSCLRHNRTRDWVDVTMHGMDHQCVGEQACNHPQAWVVRRRYVPTVRHHGIKRVVT